MATKNVSIGLSANTLYEIAESTVIVTARTVYGKVVSATTVVNQAAVAGSIAVDRASVNEHLSGTTGVASYSVSWTGLTPGSTITLSGTSGLTGIANITNIAASGSRIVDVNHTALSSGKRNLTLTASGTDGNGTTQTDNATYVQHAASGTGGSSLTVSAVTSSPVAASTTSVTFSVTYANIWGTINLSPSIGTASPTTINADGSGTTQVTVTIPANTTHNANNITLTATAAFNNKSASATIVQNGVGYDPKIWWTKTSGGASGTSVTSVTDVPAYVNGTYDGQNVVYTIYINYNSDVSANTITLNTSSLISGASANRSGKTVTVSVPVNENTTARSAGSIVVNCTAPDGTTASATLNLTQVAGVAPVFSISPASQNIAADGTSASATNTYDYVDPSSIASASTTGNITSVSIS